MYKNRVSTWEFPLFWRVIFQREASFGSLFVTVYILVKHSVLTFVSFWKEWIERLAVNAKVVTFLVSIPASSDTVESERRQITYI
jgi:hypothetical protein